MKFSFYSKKNSWSRVSLLLSTFIVLVSFFRTATAESASARKPDPGARLSGNSAKKSKQKKELGAGRDGEETLLSPLSPNSFISLFFSAALFSTTLEQASVRSNGSDQKRLNVLYPATQRTQRAVEIPEAV